MRDINKTQVLGKKEMTTIDTDFLIIGIAEALEVEPDQVTSETSSSDLEEWDSLGHISIMSFLDKNQNEITERVPDFASATSVSEIITLPGKFGQAPNFMLDARFLIVDICSELGENEIDVSSISSDFEKAITKTGIPRLF